MTNKQQEFARNAKRNQLVYTSANMVKSSVKAMPELMLCGATET